MSGIVEQALLVLLVRVLDALVEAFLKWLAEQEDKAKADNVRTELMTRLSDITIAEKPISDILSVAAWMRDVKRGSAVT